jgi:hypothetical protein
MTLFASKTLSYNLPLKNVQMTNEAKMLPCSHLCGEKDPHRVGFSFPLSHHLAVKRRIYSVITHWTGGQK